MLRAREAKMLTRDKAERMIDAPSFDEAAKMLTDCGYKDMSGFTAKQVEETLAEHRAEIFAELARLSPNAEPVEVFRMRYDYHNAKIVIKTEADGRDRTDLMSASGRVSPEVLKRSFAEEKYLGLPSVLADAMVEAKSALARSQNPQLADFILDRAYFAEICAAAKNLGSAFLRGYAQILIDAANLRSAVRTMRMNKDAEFLKTALIPGGGIDTGRILRLGRYACVDIRQHAFGKCRGSRRCRSKGRNDDRVRACLRQCRDGVSHGRKARILRRGAGHCVSCRCRG